jgi:predicted Rossmann fold nucleotide-binding protein DprA/Smf involved in DNA uptake
MTHVEGTDRATQHATEDADTMATDWNHIVLGELNRGPTTYDTLARRYPKARTEVSAAFANLEDRGHAARNGDIWAITEAGRGRYVIDDNCKGW